jgi:hypothetical protein
MYLSTIAFPTSQKYNSTTSTTKTFKRKVWNRMRGKANGTFLWVSLVTKELQEVKGGKPGFNATL